MKNKLIGILLFAFIAFSMCLFYRQAYNAGFDAGNKKIENVYSEHNHILIKGQRENDLQFLTFSKYDSITNRIKKMDCKGILIVPQYYRISEKIIIPSNCSAEFANLDWIAPITLNTNGE